MQQNDRTLADGQVWWIDRPSIGRTKGNCSMFGACCICIGALFYSPVLLLMLLMWLLSMFLMFLFLLLMLWLLLMLLLFLSWLLLARLGILYDRVP